MVSSSSGPSSAVERRKLMKAPQAEEDMNLMNSEISWFDCTERSRWWSRGGLSVPGHLHTGNSLFLSEQTHRGVIKAEDHTHTLTHTCDIITTFIFCIMVLHIMNNKTSVRLRHTPRSLNRLTAIHCNSREDQEDQEYTRQ